ncbi:uncharacterized protein LOC127848086 isoform X5 [Dreissena polymorpha]|uniref:uncharacterized protein LOC127848086 isoform X5 n=1 Tax=Dreissena polymorpha TaxID=45954 RepID=UPI002263C965|nr:uncharacterized protein LOC127848086 isoform X5 [Dreissena polymorpha]
MATGFQAASTALKATLILVIVGVVLQLIGFATSSWIAWYNWSAGLWSYANEPGWLKATQAFEVLGFIAAVVALILIILYIFVPATSGKRIVFILSILACFAAAGCILLGIIIYGSEVKHNLSWSFALCCIAGIIFAISGLLLVVDMCKR